MIRLLSITFLASIFAGSLAAQAPADLLMRVDGSFVSQVPGDVPEVTVTAIGSGLEVRTNPGVTLWQGTQRASGNYTLSGSFTLLEPSNQRHYHGLVFGGRNLGGENQRYLYFMVAETGHFVVMHRFDNANTNVVVTHTEHSAIQRPDANGRSVNHLSVRMSDEQVEFVVNGTVVHATERSGPLLDTNGIYGIRMDNLIPGVLVENLAVTGPGGTGSLLDPSLEGSGISTALRAPAPR